MTREEVATRIKVLKLKIDPPTNNQLGWLETWVHKEDIQAFDMAIKALQEPTGWISVSEELPQKGKQVLCCNESGSVFTSAITYVEKHEDGSKYVCFGKHYSVKAWMPLPEPYKEG